MEVGDVRLLAFRDIGPPELDMFGAITTLIFLGQGDSSLTILVEEGGGGLGEAKLVAEFSNVHSFLGR